MPISQLSDLLPLVGKDNAAVLGALEEHPEWIDALADIKRAKDSIEGVSVDGFKIYYQALYNRPLPDILLPIVNSFVEAFHEKSAVMLEAWRGFGKTTFLTAWCSYLMGARPVGSTATGRINDAAAVKAGKSIAAIIETNPGWKQCFPHVVPDTRAGWSVDNGFNVMDTRVTGTPDSPGFEAGYARWRQMCLADHVAEQSLLCAGIESGSFIGLHPTNGMWFDDLHDDKNTRSQAEMAAMASIVEGNIIPAWRSSGGAPTVGVMCTPWPEPNAYSSMLKTGRFKHIKLPVFTRDENGEMFEPMGYKIKPTWPEVWPVKEIEGAWLDNPARFGQMYLCDIESLKGLRLKREWLQEFPVAQIEDTWPVYFGIDFASTADKLGKKDTDYFCCAIGRAIPNGGVVLVGGFRGRLPISESLMKMQSLAAQYPTLRVVGVEKWGAGKDFADMLTPLVYSSGLPVVTFPFAGGKVLSKGQKFENVLAPAFTRGSLWIASVKNDFIKAFEDEWISWDGTKSLTRHDDALDAVYGMAYVAQQYIQPTAMRTDFANPRERGESPLAGIGAHRGYG